MAAKPLRLAADTNLLLDLADCDEDVLDAVAVIERRLPQADWLVPPSVLDELAFLTDSGDTAQLRHSARLAFQQLESGHPFRALLEIPFPSDYLKQVADEIRYREIIPAAEVHDSRVLAEAAFLECALLRQQWQKPRLTKCHPKARSAGREEGARPGTLFSQGSLCYAKLFLLLAAQAIVLILRPEKILNLCAGDNGQAFRNNGI